MNENNSNDLQTIITQVIEEMKSEQGDKFDINRISLTILEVLLWIKGALIKICHTTSPLS